ncbi:helix-turn-helix transcriptional regulator [Streptomyces sp. TP-A0356]|uniref:helix-turn-helix domain-containing protein n=1 Tax=Streptomyces sp. TP-A0356 TaxID=1359208 RepID=UPI001F2C5907|nr:helix-turn-helix transcriptional regulator [Streptomyces sp. TP-A0356]
MWGDQDVRRSLATWDFGQASRLIRQRGSLRQDDIAQLTGVSQAFLSMHESGRRRLTNIDKIVEFLSGLGVPGDLVPLPRVTPPPPGQQATAQLADHLDPDLPWTPARMVAALGKAIGGGVMDRRQFITVSGMALTAFVHHWSTAEAEPLVRAAEGCRISKGLLDSLQQTTDAAASGVSHVELSLSRASRRTARPNSSGAAEAHGP